MSDDVTVEGTFFFAFFGFANFIEEKNLVKMFAQNIFGLIFFFKCSFPCMGFLYTLERLFHIRVWRDFLAVRVHAAFAGDPGSIPSTDVVPHSHP